MKKALEVFVRLVKFEHTLFALPFAYMGMVLGQRGLPPLSRWVWVTLAMVGARTAAMCLNRIADVDLDRENPRTRDWPLVTGEISLGAVWAVTGVSLTMLLVSCLALNTICLVLSPLAVGLLFAYSYTKRFTALCHLFLGLVIACAPAGGWLAVTGRFEFPLFLLAGAVLFWLAGFDVIYATLDVDFDRSHGILSLPSRMGIGPALFVSALFHALTFLLLLALGVLMGMMTWYVVGLGITGFLLFYEHSLVRSYDLSRVNAAFFTVNGWVSVLLFTFTMLEILL